MIFIIDTDGYVKTVLSNTSSEQCPFFNDKITERLNGELQMEFEVPATHPDAPMVDIGKGILFKEVDGTYKYLRVVEVYETYGAVDNVKRVVCQGGHYELSNHLVASVGVVDGNVKTALAQVVNGSDWQVGNVDPTLTENKDIAFTMENGLEAITKILDKWECEARYRVEVKGSKIIGKYIDLYKQRGTYTGVRFTFDLNLKSVERQVDFTNVKTRLYGKGQTLFTNKNGTYEWADFQDMVWTTPKDPVDKPKGQIYLDNPEAIKKWGIRTGVYSKETDDIRLLIEETWKALKRNADPKITYTMEVVDLARISGYEHLEVGLGDLIIAVDNDLKFNFMSRVMEKSWSLTQPDESKITIGNYVDFLAREGMLLGQEIRDLALTKPSKDDLNRLGVELKDHVGDAVEHATQLITGNQGGYVHFVMNEDNQPEEILIMDTPDITTTKQLWRWNKNGFGHTNNGYGGEYDTAITMDGYIIGDFVRTGTLGSLDGTLKINLDNGVFTTYDREGMRQLELNGTNFNFYDWVDGTRSGSVSSIRNSRDKTSGISLLAEYKKTLDIGYATSNTTTQSFVRFGMSVPGQPQPITWYHDMNLGSSSMIWNPKHIAGYCDSIMYGSADGTLCIGHEHTKEIHLGTYWIGDRFTDPKLEISSGEKSPHFTVYVRGQAGMDNDLHVSKNLFVGGEKNCIQKTEDYGTLNYSAYEFNESYLGYLGEGECDETGVCYVYIDDRFLQSISSIRKYQVKTWIYDGSITQVERKDEYFIVYGSGTFGFEIMGVRRGFEKEEFSTYEVQKPIDDMNKVQIQLMELEEKEIEESLEGLGENIELEELYNE